MRVKFSFGSDVEWLRFAEGERVTVSKVLETAFDARPDLFSKRMERGDLNRPSLNVFVNRGHVRYRQGTDTLVNEGDEVYVIPFLSGG